MKTNLYETDFYLWTVEQSQLLALGKLDGLDLVNLVEEIESLGKQQKQELRNRLGVLMGHLLKWQYQPEKRSKSWRSTIREQRRETQKIIAENPSLKSYLEEAIIDGYESALDLAVRETPFDYQDLPQECPYSIAQIFDHNFSVDLEV